MQIHLDELRVLPCFMMMVFAIHASLDFNALELHLASYATLATMLMVAMCSFYLIIRQHAITRMDMLSIVFMVIVATSSLAHGTEFVQWVYVCLSFCLLRFCFNFYRDNLSPIIIGMAVGFSVATLFQMHQLITHPELWIVTEDNEVTGYVLGGNYNQIGIRLLITMLLDLLCIKISRWFYILLIPCVASCIAIPLIVGSMTAATSILLFLILCITPFRNLRRAGVAALLISVIFFQIFVCFNGKGIENNDFLVWFVEDVLEKDITFTNRTHMWDSALRIIVQSPFWGYGYPDADWYRTHMTSFAIGPHNVILAMLLYGGVIALVIYLYLFITSFAQALRISDYWADTILIGISVLCVMMLMEVYAVNIIFIFFVIAEYYPMLHAQIVAKNDQ